MSVGTGPSRDKCNTRGLIVFYILKTYFLRGKRNRGALVANLFSQISTSFIFVDLRLRNLPILYLKNSLKYSECLGSFIATTLKSLCQHQIGDEYGRSRQVFKQPRSNLIVCGKILPSKEYVQSSAVEHVSCATRTLQQFYGSGC